MGCLAFGPLLRSCRLDFVALAAFLGKCRLRTFAWQFPITSAWELLFEIFHLAIVAWYSLLDFCFAWDVLPMIFRLGSFVGTWPPEIGGNHLNLVVGFEKGGKGQEP